VLRPGDSFIPAGFTVSFRELETQGLMESIFVIGLIVVAENGSHLIPKFRQRGCRYQGSLESGAQGFRDSELPPARGRDMQVGVS
jgi:hypothetical protein